jgi:hypothetical protein
VTRSAELPRAFSAYYGADVATFLTTSPEEVVGRLALADPHGTLEATQRRAWEEEIHILRDALAGLSGALIL